jgi:hypothetical protein
MKHIEVCGFYDKQTGKAIERLNTEADRIRTERSAIKADADVLRVKLQAGQVKAAKAADMSAGLRARWMQIDADELAMLRAAGELEPAINEARRNEAVRLSGLEEERRAVIVATLKEQAIESRFANGLQNEDATVRRYATERAAVAGHLKLVDAQDEARGQVLTQRLGRSVPQFED